MPTKNIIEIVDYIVNQFNKDFSNNKDNFVLKKEELKSKERYRLYIDSNKVYYDVILVSGKLKKDEHLKLFLGTVTIGFLGEQATYSDYYFLFLKVINKLLKIQEKNKNIYYYSFPNMTKNITNFLGIWMQKGFIQESLLLPV